MGIIETYEQAIDFLFGRINYERINSQDYSTSDFKLDRMRRLLALLGNPQSSRPTIHITGTKGKGSTASMIASILQESGRRVGLFTSPHVDCFEERMRVDGRMPNHDELVGLVRRVTQAVHTLDCEPGAWGPTYFEIATAMAWLYFADEAADVVVLEVGLGGRLDSTNVCDPIVTLITNVSRDHVALLGCDLESIAAEKAGIIKQGVPLVCGVTDEPARTVIRSVAASKDAHCLELGRELFVGSPTSTAPESVDVHVGGMIFPEIAVKLPGRHQQTNAGLAIATVALLNEQNWNISEDTIRRGLQNVECPLRIEVVGTSPTVIADSAHNWASIHALIATLNASFPAAHRLLIFGTSRDKDIRGMLEQLLPEFDTVILTEATGSPRAASSTELERIAAATHSRPTHRFADAAAAWHAARQLAGRDDLICVTGSFLIAAEVRNLAVETVDHAALDSV